MHIPDGFLSGPVAGATWVIGGGGLAVALRAERHGREHAPAGVLGALAAFVFAAQMVNVPVAPGTSGHLVGATLLALLVGPWRAVIVMAVVLALQATLMQDGGLTAFGANLADMGLAGALVGATVAAFVARLVRGYRGVVAGAVFGSFVATVCGAVLTALWLSASGLYPLSGLLPLMLVTHTAIGRARGRSHGRHRGDAAALAPRSRDVAPGGGRRLSGSASSWARSARRWSWQHSSPRSLRGSRRPRAHGTAAGVRRPRAATAGRDARRPAVPARPARAPRPARRGGGGHAVRGARGLPRRARALAP